MNKPLSPDALLTVGIYPDATVYPLTPYPRPKRKQAMKMGVLDKRDKVVPRSQLWRSYGRMGFPPDSTSSPRRDGREVIYAGHLPGQFGHFLLEGLSRLWYAAQHPELPIVWGCRRDDPVDEYSRWQRDTLAILGVRNKAVFVAEPTRFDRIHVPDAGYRIKDQFSDQLRRFLAVYPARIRDPNLKLWLSRANVPAKRASEYAARLDEMLPEYGWAVIQPERLPVDKQLELLATASRVAAEEGSALHLLVLLSDVTGLEVDILCRRPDRPLERQNANYQTIAKARGLTQRRHIIPEERVLSEGFGHVQKVSTTLAGHLEALGVPPRPSAPESPAPESPAPSALAEFIRAQSFPIGSYLELGDGSAPVYPFVEATRRDVVRTAFAFDPRTETAPGSQLYEMPLAEFFAFYAEPERPYDLVLLDHLGAGPLQRAFESSLALAHAETRWIVAGRTATKWSRPTWLPSDMETEELETGEGPAIVMRRRRAPEQEVGR